ncbi:MAG TPA: DNA gyrase inhibitor YacG [Dissulfurispiraceae bacterium]|nr:DNA gyrase inhibitor YacG [Dissulfurispiraceae bacterium]
MPVSCPCCRNKTTWEENPWRPFCSERCKMVDLGRWALEDYRIEGAALDEYAIKPDQDAS